MSKGTRLYSIIHNKCPKCQEGSFFESQNPYKLSSFSKMPKNCECCSMKYEPETGFYYGAMFVSYGMGVALFVAVWATIGALWPEASALAIISSILIALVVFFPLSFRLSRLIWINIFTKYQGEKKNNSITKSIN